MHSSETKYVAWTWDSRYSKYQLQVLHLNDPTLSTLRLRTSPTDLTARSKLIQYKANMTMPTLPFIIWSSISSIKHKSMMKKRTVGIRTSGYWYFNKQDDREHQTQWGKAKLHFDERENKMWPLEHNPSSCRLTTLRVVSLIHQHFPSLYTSSFVHQSTNPVQIKDQLPTVYLRTRIYVG